MKGPAERVARATAWLVTGRVYAAACALLATWLLTEYLSLADLGRFSFYLAVLALSKSVGDLGTGQVVVQRTAHDEASIPLELSAARRVRGVTSALGAVAVALFFWFTDERDPMWLALAALHPLTYLLELSSTVYKNRITWAAPVAARALASSLVLGALWSLGRSGCDRPAVFLAAQVGCHLVANVFLHLAARRHLQPHPGGAVPWRALLRVALPLGVAALCQQAYHHADIFLIRAFLDDEALGLYGIAFRFLSVGIMVALFATNAALPLLSSAHRAGTLSDEHARYARPLALGAGLACGLALPWCAELLGIFGQEFTAAAGAMRWMLLSCVAIHFGALQMTSLVACGRTELVLRVAAVALAIDLGLNLWLLPIHGIEGAAVARACTELFVAGWARLALTRCGVPLRAAPALTCLAGTALLFLLGATLSSHLPLEGLFEALSRTR